MSQLGKRKSILLSSFSSRRSLRSIVTDESSTASRASEVSPSSRNIRICKPGASVVSLLESASVASVESPFISTLKRSEYGDSPKASESSVYTTYLASDTVSKRSHIPRSSHFENIASFINHKGVLPVSSDRSLELETRELQSYRPRTSLCDEDFELHLVENAIFMTFCLKEANRLHSTNSRFWDDLDLDEVLKGDITPRTESLLAQ